MLIPEGVCGDGPIVKRPLRVNVTLAPAARSYPGGSFIPLGILTLTFAAPAAILDIALLAEFIELCPSEPGSMEPPAGGACPWDRDIGGNPRVPFEKIIQPIGIFLACEVTCTGGAAVGG